MTEQNDDYDDERQAQADDEAEPVPEAESAALKARIVIRGMLDEVQGAISRTRTPGMPRVEAASHVKIALAYMATPHVGLAACHLAWSLAFLDLAAKRSKLPAAIAARWSEVRAALPESIQKNMGDRSWTSGAGRRKQRAARPTTTADQGEQRRGA